MKKFWKTASGQKIRIVDMSDSHLQNTIRFVHRNYNEILDVSPPAFSGEMAQYCADLEYNTLVSMIIEEFCPSYTALMTEANKRGIWEWGMK